MGWNTGNDVFDPVCKFLIAGVQQRSIKEWQAEEILVVLIEALQESDWDTENESLDEFKEYPYVVNAFRRREIPLEEEE